PRLPASRHRPFPRRDRARRLSLARKQFRQGRPNRARSPRAQAHDAALAESVAGELSRRTPWRRHSEGRGYSPLGISLRDVAFRTAGILLVPSAAEGPALW